MRSRNNKQETEEVEVVEEEEEEGGEGCTVHPKPSTHPMGGLNTTKALLYSTPFSLREHPLKAAIVCGASCAACFRS